MTHTHSSYGGGGWFQTMRERKLTEVDDDGRKKNER
jgi:hypothetical protein